MKTYSLDYKQLLGKTKPVVNDFVCNEDGYEVERITLAEMKDGKWVEDYIIVKRIEANTMIDDDGAVASAGVGRRAGRTCFGLARFHVERSFRWLLSHCMRFVRR